LILTAVASLTSIAQFASAQTGGLPHTYNVSWQKETPYDANNWTWTDVQWIYGPSITIEVALINGTSLLGPMGGFPSHYLYPGQQFYINITVPKSLLELGRNVSSISFSMSKSETYYTITQHEIQGKETVPSSKETLEAFIVPLCLEKAKRSGISTCNWEISYGYTPIPSIVFGIHYFSDPSEYSIVRDSDIAKEIIKHITNHGKYPFCYEPITDSSEVVTIFSVFGLTTVVNPEIRSIVENIYHTFQIPALNIVLVYDSGHYALACLTTAKYSKLSNDDRKLLETMVAGSNHE
jgi:hypothetical protein